MLLAEEDARRLGVVDGGAVRLVSRQGGELVGRARIAPIKPGNVEVHWPEGMVLLDPEDVDPQSGEPDYGACVRLEPVAR